MNAHGKSTHVHSYFSKYYLYQTLSLPRYLTSDLYQQFLIRIHLINIKANTCSYLFRTVLVLDYGLTMLINWSRWEGYLNYDLMWCLNIFGCGSPWQYNKRTPSQRASRFRELFHPPHTDPPHHRATRSGGLPATRIIIQSCNICVPVCECRQEITSKSWLTFSGNRRRGLS